MANGYGNIVGRRGGALNLARPQRMRALPARRRPPRVRVRARQEPDPGSRAGGGRNPGRSNAEVMAELQELGVRGAQEMQERESARQAAIETRNMRDARLRELGQTVRGESPAQLEAQERRVAMEQQRDAEQERRRFRATAQMGSLLDQRYEELRREGEIKLQGKELAGFSDMNPGWVPRIDRETGKPRPIYVREEPSGEPGSEEIVFGFYEEDDEGNRVQIRSGRGEPIRPNRGVMARMAQMNELDRRERSGIPGRVRKARQEEVTIAGMEAEAERDLAEAGFARRGKPKAINTTMTPRERQKALLDTQKLYADLLTAEQEYTASGVTPPPEHTALKMQVEQRMNMLGRGTGQAVPTQAAPATSQVGPQPGAVVNGFRFLGGDPNNQANWEAI